MESSTSCCTHCVHTLSEGLRNRRAEGQPEGQPAAPPAYAAASKKSCTSAIFRPLVWTVGKVASLFCGSASTQLTGGSCFSLTTKAFSNLQNIKDLPAALTPMRSALSESSTLTAVKDTVVGQFSSETLAQFSACGKAGLDALYTMPSSALLVAVATDTVVSQVLLSLIGASWLTTAVQMGASFYVSSHFCGSTVGDVKELVIGYTVYRLVNGVYDFMVKPQS